MATGSVVPVSAGRFGLQSRGTFEAQHTLNFTVAADDAGLWRYRIRARYGDVDGVHEGLESVSELLAVVKVSASAEPNTSPPSSGLPATEQREMLEHELAQHQRNLARLREKKAIYAAGEEPLSLLNQIDAEVQEVARVQAQLEALSRG
jgi:hypothetical protein